MPPRYKYVLLGSTTSSRSTRQRRRSRKAASLGVPPGKAAGPWGVSMQDVDYSLQQMRARQRAAPSDLSNLERAYLRADARVRSAERHMLDAGQLGLTESQKQELRRKAAQEMTEAVQMFQRIAKASDPEDRAFAERAANHYDLLRRRWGYRASTWKRGSFG